LDFLIDVTPPAALWPWGSTRPLTEMSTRNLRGGKRRPTRKDDSLNAIYEPIVSKMWEPRRLTTLWVSTACYRISLPFLPLLLCKKLDGEKTGNSNKNYYSCIYWNLERRRLDIIESDAI
jgi:hypothetical protein